MVAWSQVRRREKLAIGYVNNVGIRRVAKNIFPCGIKCTRQHMPSGSTFATAVYVIACRWQKAKKGSRQFRPVRLQLKSRREKPRAQEAPMQTRKVVRATLHLREAGKKGSNKKMRKRESEGKTSKQKQAKEGQTKCARKADEATKRLNADSIWCYGCMSQKPGE